VSPFDGIDITYHLVELFSFSFTRVMPGKYNLKASHASWSFENVSKKQGRKKKVKSTAPMGQ